MLSYGISIEHMHYAMRPNQSCRSARRPKIMDCTNALSLTVVTFVHIVDPQCLIFGNAVISYFHLIEIKFKVTLPKISLAE